MTWSGDERRKGNNNLLERIHELETSVSTLTTSIDLDRESTERLINQLMDLVKTHDIVIFGGQNGPGLKEEVNSLKRIEGERKTHMNVLTAATVVAVVNMVFSWIKKALAG